MFRIVFIVFLFHSYQLFSQQTNIVDFIQVDAEIKPDFKNRTVSGNATYIFKILKNTDSIYLDAHRMKIYMDSDKVKIKTTEDKLWLINSFKKDKTYSVSFSFSAQPKQTFYFMHSGDEFWTQGQGKYTSHWLPSIDDTNDKIIFNLAVTAPAHLTVVANGELQEKKDKGDQTVWKFSMTQPMSSYLVAVAGADYAIKKEKSASGIPLELYYKKKDSAKVEATYRNIVKTFDFLEEEIGVAYPWKVYKQVPVSDFFYAGMENTTATIFSEFYMTDEIGVKDIDYTNVEAHELAHQWFGNLVTAKSDEHHWLQEGFSTYYALLAEKNIYGDDYFQYRLLEYASLLMNQDLQGKAESLLNPKASSLTFYQKGAWALHVLKRKVGADNFKKAVRNFLIGYQFDVATTDDFMNEIKRVSIVDLSDYEQQWFYETAFPQEDVYSLLMESDYIQKYWELIGSLQKTSTDDFPNFILPLIENYQFQISETAIASLANKPEAFTNSIYEKIIKSNNVDMRQALVLTIEDIPESLYDSFQTLLSDSSYVTRQVTLKKLWKNFPEKRRSLLNEMKNEIGLQNKNIRQSWLVLALRTEDYKLEKKSDFRKEVKNYASPKYSFEIREIAFENINRLELWDAQTLQYLLNAVRHPSWRFAKKSRELFHELWDSLSKSEKEQMTKNLTLKEREILKELTK